MEDRQTGERNKPVFLIDFNNSDNNSFIAINQFKVREHGKTTHIIPDIMLFINGFPIGIVECKSPAIS